MILCLHLNIHNFQQLALTLMRIKSLTTNYDYTKIYLNRGTSDFTIKTHNLGRDNPGKLTNRIKGVQRLDKVKYKELKANFRNKQTFIFLGYCPCQVGNIVFYQSSPKRFNYKNLETRASI